MDILNLFSAAFDLKYVENTTFKKKTLPMHSYIWDSL